MYDNFAKNVDLAKPVASLAQDQKWPVKTYVFVSSGTQCFLDRNVDRDEQEVAPWVRSRGEDKGLFGAMGRLDGRMAAISSLCPFKESKCLCLRLFCAVLCRRWHV